MQHIAIERINRSLTLQMALIINSIFRNDKHTTVTSPISGFVFCNVMAPSVECPVAVADNFSTALLVGRKCKVNLAIDLDFKTLIVDQGPNTNIAFTVHCDIGKQQLQLKFRRRSKLRTVDGVVVASLSDRKKPRPSDFFVRTVSGGICID